MTLREALAAARAIGEEREVGIVLWVTALLSWRAGDRAGAERMAAEAYDVARRDGGPEALSFAGIVAAHLAIQGGRTDRARAPLGEALALADGMDFPWSRRLRGCCSGTWRGRRATPRRPRAVTARGSGSRATGSGRT